MARVKASSTNQLNKRLITTKCPVTFTVFKMGGRWKPIILHHLTSGAKHYADLRKAIPGISEKMLFQHLRELEADEIITRKVFETVPPQVEYSLTSCGEDLIPILKAMSSWGLKYNIILE